MRINDDKLLEKHKTICTITEDLRNIKFNDWLVYDDRYIKTKVRTSADNVYKNFRILRVPGVECESFTIISTDSLLVYKKWIFSASIFIHLCL